MTHALLLTGGDVLIVGEEWTGCGEGPGSLDTTQFAEMYLTATGTWKKATSLNVYRLGMVAVPLADGRALVTAGQTSDWWSFSSAKIFDPATLKWTQPALMRAARTEPAAALLKDGRVLVASGWYTSPSRQNMIGTAEIFDPATGKWTLTGSLHAARAGAQAVTLTDGRVLVVGGRNISGNAPIASAEIWDPATGAWSSAGSLATARANFSLVALTDGSALVVGGAGTAAASAERFDPAAMTWAPAGIMNLAAARRSVVVLADGRVLAAGGLVGSGPTALAELYDPATGTWTPTVPLPSPRADGAAVLLGDGSVLIAGGDAGATKPTAPGGGSGCPKLMPEALRYIPPVP